MRAWFRVDVVVGRESSGRRVMTALVDLLRRLAVGGAGFGGGCGGWRTMLDNGGVHAANVPLSTIVSSGGGFRAE